MNMGLLAGAMSTTMSITAHPRAILAEIFRDHPTRKLLFALALSSGMVRILVPHDGSAEAESALEEALDLFSDEEIHVLHVLQVTRLPKDETESAFGLAASEADDILDGAEEIAADHGQQIVTEALEGNAAKTILSYAEDNDVDHIVMGSTGRSGIRRILLGSVAEAVIRRAPCSVTVVRE